LPVTPDDAVAPARVTDESLFLENLPVIDHVTTQICRRHRLSAAETDEFRSDVRMHFLERDCDVLKQFEGRSSLPTYLTVVIQRLFLDRRNRLWGKWRPSAEARRLGPTAILLERLVTRDGWSAEQALEILRTNHGVAIDDTLRALCDKMTRKAPSRQFVGPDEADDMPPSNLQADANVLRAEQDFLAKRVQTALDRARQALGPDERLILKMRFEDGMTVSNIARALHLDQKRLYRTLDGILSRLGESLIRDGVSKEDVGALFASLAPGTDRETVDERAVAYAAPMETARTTWLQK
jgi:RNA polymerase sigma factor for flagellar operon FliA